MHQNNGQSYNGGNTARRPHVWGKKNGWITRQVTRQQNNNNRLVTQQWSQAGYSANSRSGKQTEVRQSPCLGGAVGSCHRDGVLLPLDNFPPIIITDIAWESVVCLRAPASPPLSGCVFGKRKRQMIRIIAGRIAYKQMIEKAPLPHK